METRKVQEVSGGTFTVSLPADWAEDAGIEQGTPVTVSTHIDGLLVIQPETDDEDASTRASVELDSEADADVEHLVWAAYVVGVDELTLTARGELTEAQRRAARDLVGVLAGVTIASETEDELRVRMLLDSGEISVRQLVRQLGFTALSMHREAIAVLTEEGTVTDLADRDDQADRLYAMTDRSFERTLRYLHEVDALGLTRSEVFELWTTARELERVADHAERIATIGVELDPTQELRYQEDIERLSRLARTVVEDAIGSIVGDAGMDAAREALCVRGRVREEAATLDRRLFQGSSAEYYHVRILDSIRRTAEHGGNIGQRGIQAAIRRENEPDANVRPRTTR